MKLAVFILVILPSFAFCAPKCQEVDGSTKLTHEQWQIVSSLGGEWLTHATFCDFGTYQVMTPSDGKSDVIVVLKHERPFVTHEPGFGINLFQDIGDQRSVPYVSVQDLDHTGIFRHLDYALLDTSGNVVGNVRDKAMTGDVAITLYSYQPAKRK